MNFISQQNKDNINLYFSYLRAVCALSRLFGESNVPYVYYRISENIFCKSFNAQNLSRSDLAYDAKIGKVGIGLKTFISHRGKSLEKIAEFDKLSPELRELSITDLILKLSKLRNERIDFANRTYGLEKGIYHCVARKENLIQIFETDYDYIDSNSIKIIKRHKTSLHFTDGVNEYSFNFPKSTLFKRFYTPDNSIKIKIQILEDPYSAILELFQKGFVVRKIFEIPGKDFVILPLYSLILSKDEEKIVPEKSGLNQWNAGGRKRNLGEVYIPIPAIIRKSFPYFFPPKDKIFNLHVPTNEILSTKICQANNKALMTKPNKALSDWLLRKVLKLNEGELLTYDKLKILGIDSVRINKIDKNNYKIDFAKIGNFNEFIDYCN
ncbi:MAG: restriction endonuclease [Candidatus Cloacimonetes bacterium]|nr:restriction endonuclease [Candidatus Cloacimonadota bacterium]